MTILITGAAGFIGSNVCKMLLKSHRSTTVVGIDNYAPYYSTHLKKRRITELSTYKHFVFVQSSFFHKQTLLNVQKKYKPSVLLHAAAEVGVRNGELHPLSYMKTNVLGTTVLMETIGETIRHIVALSSSSVYGNTRVPFQENAALQPISMYGTSKLCMEHYLKNFWTRRKIPVSIVRPFSVYGPDGRPDMLPMKLLSTSLHGQSISVRGSAIQRDWSYIDDVASALIHIVSLPHALEIVNVGFGKPISNREVLLIAAKIIRTYGYTLSYSFIDPNPVEMSATWADVTTLRKQYGKKMTTPFKIGFAHTAAFFFAHRNLYRKI